MRYSVLCLPEVVLEHAELLLLFGILEGISAEFLLLHDREVNCIFL
jgi:hypothetical protein